MAMQDKNVVTVSLDDGLSVRMMGGEQPVKLLEVRPEYRALPIRQRLEAIRQIQAWLLDEVEKINKEIGDGPKEE